MIWVMGYWAGVAIRHDGGKKIINGVSEGVRVTLLSFYSFVLYRFYKQ
jgi:hypothetical protein